ncbi:MAG TPA: hypothetical protein VGL46_12595 [Pseudonocardiaceae bacterium]|jgi:hypothetical protein
MPHTRSARSTPEPILGTVDRVVTSDQSFAADAMRSTPAEPQSPDIVRGVLIPHDPAQPIQLVDLAGGPDGQLVAALEPHLGRQVDAATCLSTLDFITNDDDSYTVDPARYYNSRASIIRVMVWRAAAEGRYAVSDADADLARDMLTVEPRHLMLFGPVVALGVVPETGAWVSVSDDVAGRLLASGLVLHSSEDTAR